ncbi:1-acyl-sn-glycerol-3-phosphate acyltransferase [Nymphaea thermarum]|nr:1-acyl-sn-glycerol-3-phosphate acyltransferase [Nymphaea thermarum]
MEGFCFTIPGFHPLPKIDYYFGLQRLKDFPRPFWLALFVEGTRFTQAKLVAAQEYAEATGLPVPRNVLIPRTKGFVSAVATMRSFVPAIYDVTIAIPKDHPSPTMLSILKGKSSVEGLPNTVHSPTESFPSPALFIARRRTSTIDTVHCSSHVLPPRSSPVPNAPPSATRRLRLLRLW